MDLAASAPSESSSFRFLFLRHFVSVSYWATWLPIVPYCVEWATHGLSIVGSPLEASDKSCLKNSPKCV